MSIESMLEHAAVAAQQGDWGEAKKYYKKVLAQDGMHVQALASLASIQARAGNFSEASSLYQQALGFDASVPEVWFNFGNLLVQTGRRPEAENAFRNALKLNDQLAPAWFSLAVLLYDMGESAEAEACFRKTTELAPGFAAAHNKFGDFLLDRHRPEEALVHYGHYRELNPADLHICLNMVDALVELGAPGDAIDLLKSALKSEPENEIFLLPLAHLLPLAGREQEAIQCWLALLDKAQYSQEAHFNLGLLLYRRKEYLQAVLHLRQAVALAPGDLKASIQLGFSLAELGQVSEARTIAANLVAQHPHAELAQMLDGFVAIQQARIADGLDAYQRALAINPNSTSAISNICQGSMYADFLDAEEVTALHVRMSGMLSKTVETRIMQTMPIDAGRRIRVGYISPDFRSHPVGFFLQPILENHDHDAFEIFGYGTGAEPDLTGQSLVSHLDHWHYCSAMTDEELAFKIRDDRLDILVDAGGYTANSRVTVLARRVAPVQASYLGYPCTTGMDQADFVIGDGNLMPNGSERLYSEQQIRLAGSFLCFVPRPATPAVGPLPLLGNAHVTFGSFNNLSKVSDRCVRVWAEVLRAVNGSRLLLKAQVLMDPGTCELIWRRFEARGIERERVLLEGPTTPLEVFLQEYARVDIALDSMPYCGGTTSCDALWMGVPLVSLAGRHFYERMGESILHALGRPEWVTEDEASYVAMAVNLAGDPARLKGIREALREQMRSSPLCDATSMAREMERAFLKMLG